MKIILILGLSLLSFTSWSCPQLEGQWTQCYAGGTNYAMDITITQNGETYHVRTTDLRDGTRNNVVLVANPEATITDVRIPNTNVMKRTISRVSCLGDELVVYDRVLRKADGAPNWIVVSTSDARYSIGWQGELRTARLLANRRTHLTACY